MYYTDNTTDLISICNEINNKANIIAIDTEFVKQKEYFPTLSLIQVSFFNGENIKNCIIDVLSDDIDLNPFFQILENEKIKKIFHSCSQDLEALYFISKKIPKNIEDTQIMAEFCGLKSNIGYTDLIKETLKIIIKKEKSIQVSNWKKRPLTNQQLEYAINDVDYLLEIYLYLLNQLNSNKNYNYYREELENKYNDNMIERLKNNSWKKFRFKIGNKTNNYINLLKQIFYVREKLAMENNLIRNLIFPEDKIKFLITNSPKSIEDWNNIFKDNNELLLKSNKLKQSFIDIFINFKQEEEKEYIIELNNNRLLSKYNEIHDYLIAESKKMNINSELIINKIDLISYISNSETLENIYEPWKIELFGEKIRKIKNI